MVYCMGMDMRGKKTIYAMIGVTVLVVVGLMFVRGLSGEDTWICDNGEWVEHGKPSAPKPSEPCGNEPASSVPQSGLELSSTEFKWGGRIPKKYTCDGENVNPPFDIVNVPEGTQGLAMIMDDPDAPSGTFTHWTWWNALPSLDKIHENSVPVDARLGTTGAGTVGYRGPCPPTGRHQYRFQLYALDIKLTLIDGAKREALEQAMQGHILGQTTYVGLYNR